MAKGRVIEVPLPEGAALTDDELELLETTLKTIVELRYEGSRRWEAVARRLEEGGWAVHTRLGWIAEARRARDFERASGRTKDEAFAELLTLTQLDTAPAYP